jgi:hypothetical protein
MDKKEDVEVKKICCECKYYLEYLTDLGLYRLCGHESMKKWDHITGWYISDNNFENNKEGDCRYYDKRTSFMERIIKRLFKKSNHP